MEKKSDIVTTKLLKELGASCSGLRDFKRIFPGGAEITLKNCLKATKNKLDIRWFASRYLSYPAREVFEKAVVPAREALDKAVASAKKAYDKAVVPAREAYEKAVVPAREALDKAVAPAVVAFEKAVAPAKKAYDKAVALAFYKAYQSI